MCSMLIILICCLKLETTDRAVMLSFFFNNNIYSSLNLLVMFVLQLWVGPGSKAAEEKDFFDSHLAPFYRIEQVSVVLIISFTVLFSLL